MVKAVTVGVVLGSLALAPAAAHAATAGLSRDGTELHVDSGVNETNNLRVSFDGTKFIVEDLSGGDVNPGRDCRALVRKARCDGGFARVVVDLGTKDDRVDIQINKPVTADGGSGDDQINTSGQADKIKGGLGNDTASGGSGDDELDGGAGDDTLSGDDGRDQFFADSGADEYRGGHGSDFVLYSRLITGPGVAVALDDIPNDGRPGENDNIRTDVEAVTGSAFDDVMTGGLGDDTLFGSDGADRITGGPGEDHIKGFGGNDVINAREDPPTASKDLVVCGGGTDQAFVDLVDEVFSEAGSDALCETIERAPVGQGPNVRIARKRIKASRSGRVRIPLSCPRAQPHGCKGTLALSGSKGRARFDLAPGQKTVARRRLAPKHRRRLRQRRRGIRLKAVAHELDPFGRPKTTSTIFRLRLRKQ
jgi:Ca2+-binding RTX toxin-like protein